MTNYKKSSDRERFERLKGSMSEQAKIVGLSVGLDLASIAAGWITARVVGRPSLLLGMASYGTGKVLGFREELAREERRINGSEKSAEKFLSVNGVNTEKTFADDFYRNENLLVPFGFGLMIGGAMGGGSLGEIDQTLSATEKAKSAFTQIKEDLTYRLYLDKLFKPKTATNNLPAATTVPGTATPEQTQAPVNGLGEIDVFVAGDAFANDPDMKQLSRMEDQLKISARDFDTRQRETQSTTVSSPVLSATPQMSNQYEDFEDFETGHIL